MWRVESTSQVETSIAQTTSHHPLDVSYNLSRVVQVIKFLQARVNVPGLSERTFERDIVKSGYSTGAEVQV